MSECSLATRAVRLQRHPDGEDIIFDSLDELRDLGRFLPRSEETAPSSDGPAAKRAAVATMLSQHFNKKWDRTGHRQCSSKLGTAEWRAGLDRPVGNLTMPGAEIDGTGRLAVGGVPYINASSVPPVVAGAVPPMPHYVVTQHPMPGTVGDFWRMVLVERPACIVMLNGYDYAKVGDGDPAEACAPYWSPWEVGPATGLQLEELGREVVPNHGAEDVVLTLRISPRSGDHGLGGEAGPHVVRHLCASWWRDQDSPLAEQFVAFWCLLDKVIAETSASLPADAAPKVVAHCAGGIGRVGMLVAVDLSARAAMCESGTAHGPFARRGAAVSPDISIGYLRSRRANMVQSEQQYLAMHYVTGAVASLLKGSRSAPSVSAALAQGA